MVVLLAASLLLAGCGGENSAASGSDSSASSEAVSSESEGDSELELTVLEENAVTLSGGTAVNLCLRAEIEDEAYCLEDGTILLTVSGPDRMTTAEGDGGLNDAARSAVDAFYEELGLLYDVNEVLETAYSDYLACRENEGTYLCGSLAQYTFCTLSGETVVCFQTEALLSRSPLDSELDSITLNHSFDRETGENISQWELFSVPEEEARQWLLEKCAGTDDVPYEELDAALIPEYISVYPDLTVFFPEGTLSSRNSTFGYEFAYDDESLSMLQPWLAEVVSQS